MKHGRPALLLVGVLCMVGVAGCGGGSTGKQASSSSTTTGKATTSVGSDPGAALQQDYVRVVDQVTPSVVQITTSTGLGSGIVYDTKGDIVTNDHVVLGATSLHVQLASGGASLPATLVGSYPPDDLAVIKVSGTPRLHPATFGNSSAIQVGEITLAIGNPLAYESSVTQGIVSGVGRTVVEPQTSGSPGGTIANAIQTSAAINPGNSGGALVDLSGHVIGIPTLAAEDPQIGGAAVGIGFAIPSNTVTDIATQIIAHGHVTNSHRADLGIYAYAVSNVSGQPAGVGVERVIPGGPAASAGIRAGSIITAINGTAITSLATLDTVLARLNPGQRVTVAEITPSGSKTSVTVTLGTLPGTVTNG